MIYFKKLKKQIKPLHEFNGGYIFLATDEQKNDFVTSVAMPGRSKKQALKTMAFIINNDADFAKHFRI